MKKNGKNEENLEVRRVGAIRELIFFLYTEEDNDRMIRSREFSYTSIIINYHTKGINNSRSRETNLIDGTRLHCRISLLLNGILDYCSVIEMGPKNLRSISCKWWIESIG